MKEEEEEGNFFSREGNESETRQSRSMKFEKESIFMQILNERRKKKRERERQKNPSWKLVYQSRKQKTKCES